MDLSNCHPFQVLHTILDQTVNVPSNHSSVRSVQKQVSEIIGSSELALWYDRWNTKKIIADFFPSFSDVRRFHVKIGLQLLDSNGVCIKKHS
jgi:hypothetical protein